MTPIFEALTPAASASGLVSHAVARSYSSAVPRLAMSPVTTTRWISPTSARSLATSAARRPSTVSASQAVFAEKCRSERWSTRTGRHAGGVSAGVGFAEGARRGSLACGAGFTFGAGARRTSPAPDAGGAAPFSSSRPTASISAARLGRSVRITASSSGTCPCCTARRTTP